MTPKQTRFVAEYLIDLNATQTAIRAGYAAKRADSAGHQLLRNTEIAAAVAEGKERQMDDADLKAARVLEELRRLAFVDIRGFFDEAGNLKPIGALTADQGAALGGFEVIKKNAQAGDGVVDTVHKIKLWDKVRALDSLAKHFGLLTEQVKHSGTLVIQHELPE
jgi:phage terminase small subunit